MRGIQEHCQRKKALAHLELNLPVEVKGKKKGFFKYVSSQKKAREHVGLLLSEVGAMVMESTEKMKLPLSLLSLLQPPEKLLANHFPVCI